MGRERTAGPGRRHGTIGAAQAALAVLVAGGVALGALLLHPDTGLLAKGRGPLGGNPVLVIGLALLALLGGLRLRERYREHVGTTRELDPVEQRVADGVSRVLRAASLVVPLLVVTLHRFGSHGGSHDADHQALPFPSLPQHPADTPPPAQRAGHAGHSTHIEMTHTVLALGVALLVVAVVVAGLRLWRNLRRPPAPGPTATYATLDDAQERLVQAVDSGRRALLDAADARTAVIACYAAMEDSLADSGVTRHASDSPQDLLERAVASGLPAESAAATLTALFREARYSTHPMDDGHRDRAAAALAEIADGLRSRTSGPEDVPGAP